MDTTIQDTRASPQERKGPCLCNTFGEIPMPAEKCRHHALCSAFHRCHLAPLQCHQKSRGVKRSHRRNALPPPFLLPFCSFVDSRYLCSIQWPETERAFHCFVPCREIGKSPLLPLPPSLLLPPLSVKLWQLNKNGTLPLQKCRLTPTLSPSVSLSLPLSARQLQGDFCAVCTASIAWKQWGYLPLRLERYFFLLCTAHPKPRG